MNHHDRDAWVKSLHNRELNHFAASILEALEPFHLLLAQLVYISQPLASTFFSDEKIASLAALLEDPAQAHHFVDALKSNTPKS